MRTKAQVVPGHHPWQGVGVAAALHWLTQVLSMGSLVWMTIHCYQCLLLSGCLPRRLGRFAHLIPLTRKSLWRPGEVSVVDLFT